MWKPYVKPGEPAVVDAAEFNARQDEIERRSDLTAAFPLKVAQVAGGFVVSNERRRGFYAKVTGSANPYQFQEVVLQDDGTFLAVPGFVGDGSATALKAYEVNSTTGLNGQVFWLEPGAAGDFRFQAVRKGGGGGGGPCAYKVTLKNRRTNAIISGASVTFGGGTGPDVSGSTDSTGAFTAPGAVGQHTTVTVTFGGCSYTGAAGCSTIDLCYCRASLTVTSSVGTPTINPPWPGSTTSPGNYTYCDIRPCTQVADLPKTFAIKVTAAGFASACQSVTVNCGDDATVDLVLAGIPSCYVDVSNSITCCGANCTNPSTLGGSGVLPSVLKITFTSLPVTVGGVTAPRPIFGADEGVQITLPLTSDVTTGGTRVITWSVCQGGNGNFISMPSFAIDRIVPGDTSQIPFGSTLAIVSMFCAPSSTTLLAGYAYYKLGGCVPDTTHAPVIDNSAPSFGGQPGFPLCGLAGGGPPAGDNGQSSDTIGRWHAVIEDGCAGGMMAMLAPAGPLVRFATPTPDMIAPPEVDPAVRDRVVSCPHRGPEGGLVLLEEEQSCCGSGDERTACAIGRGARPGRVTLRDCLACAAVSAGWPPAG